MVLVKEYKQRINSKELNCLKMVKVKYFHLNEHSANIAKLSTFPQILYETFLCLLLPYELNILLLLLRTSMQYDRVA